MYNINIYYDVYVYQKLPRMEPSRFHRTVPYICHVPTCQITRPREVDALADQVRGRLTFELLHELLQLLVQDLALLGCQSDKYVKRLM